MLNRILFLLFISALVASGASAQIRHSSIKAPIINSKGNPLIKPSFPDIALSLCASGKVEIEVSIDEKGSVVESEFASGDEIFREVSIEAARASRFPPHEHSKVKTKGIVVYNFPAPANKKCIEAGILNGRASSLPRPELDANIKGHFRFNKEIELKVRVLVDIGSGKVVAAKVISGNPLVHPSVLEAARKTIFPPFAPGSGTFAKGSILYILKTDKSFEASPFVEVSLGEAMFLPKPVVPCFSGKFSRNEKIIIEARIDKEGRIKSAHGLSGHPFFRSACLQIAKESIFYPTYKDGKATEAKVLIIYQFEGLEIKEISAAVSASDRPT